MHAGAKKAGRVDMADAESVHRSIRTNSRQRITYGITIAIVGGRLSGSFRKRHFLVLGNAAVL